MSLKYVTIFLITAAEFAWAGVAMADSHVLATVGLGYASFSFALAALAYGGLGPRLMMKRQDGGRHPLGWILLGPFLLFTMAAIRLYPTRGRLPFVQVEPHLYFGRRLSAAQAKVARMVGWKSVLDLACELTEVAELRQVEHYRSLPVLDGTAPTREQLDSAVDWLRAALERGPVYVHCAVGMGRSAMIVIAYLLAEGKVATVDEGLTLLRTRRPGVGLRPQQTKRLQEILAAIGQRRPMF